MKTLLCLFLFIVFNSCTQTNSNTVSESSAMRPDKLKISWGGDVLFAENDTLYLMGYINETDTIKSIRKMKIGPALFDSLVAACRQQIFHPYTGDLTRSTCFAGTTIRISLQSGAAMQSVEYFYLTDQEQLPPSLKAIRNKMQALKKSMR
ncbi:MAG: hypothetical protein IM638_02865 [Bacteroidetes bacterium]|nr:hypothetical protein [Bacteroidota bacterium]